MMARFYKLLEENVEHNTIGRLPIVQLTVQYRMHPDICLFPANYIYNRNLRTNRWVSGQAGTASVLVTGQSYVMVPCQLVQTLTCMHVSKT